MRARRLAAGALATVLGLGAGGARAQPPAAPPPGPMLARAFTAEAAAFPVEAAPGENGTVLPARPFATRADVANSPASAHAQASELDLGFTETLTGTVGDRAESSYPPSNVPADATVDRGTSHFVAHADAHPSSRADAVGATVPVAGGTVGALRSSASADGGGGTVVAVADAELHGVRLGPLAIDVARFRARVSAAGRADTASAEGVVELLGATVTGVPVVIDSTGVTIDRTRVPFGEAAALAAVVADALSSSGYSQLQLVQPHLASAPDGTRASASGGGLFVRGTNNDPSQDYFIGATLLGGSVSVAVGAPLGAVGADVVPAVGLPRPPAPAPAPLPIAESSTVSPAGALPSSPPRPAPRFALATAVGARELPGPSGALVWLAVAAAGLAGVLGLLWLPVLGPGRRRLAAALTAAAERYVRG